MSRGERMPAEMAVPEATVEGAGKAVAAEVKAAEVEAVAAEVAAAKVPSEMAAASRLRIRSDGESEHRCKHGCEHRRKYHGTYSNSSMWHGSLLQPSRARKHRGAGQSQKFVPR
jgi:hypothetical protein